MQMLTMFQHAETYAERGFIPIMLRSSEKVPIKKEWTKITMENWRENFDKTHVGNIGIRTGKTTSSTIIGDNYNML